MRYVGQRKGKPEDKQNKNYFGSGTIISRIIKKRGTYFLKKIILGVCYDAKELTECETECKLFFNVLDPLYGYNLVKYDYIPMSGRHHTEKSCKKISDSKNSKSKIEKLETGKKISITKNSKSEIEKLETSKKMSIAHKNKKHSIETCNKISKKTSGKNNPMFGKYVYSVWVKKYGKEEADKRQEKRIEKSNFTKKNKSEEEKIIEHLKRSKSASGKNNGMYNISVYERWIQLYGKDEADKREIKWKKNIGISSKGSKNPSAKKYLLISPEGKEIFLHGEFCRFCKKYRLTPRYLRKVANGLLDNYKGWKCFKI